MSPLPGLIAILTPTGGSRHRLISVNPPGWSRDADRGTSHRAVAASRPCFIRGERNPPFPPVRTLCWVLRAGAVALGQRSC